MVGALVGVLCLTMVQLAAWVMRRSAVHAAVSAAARSGASVGLADADRVRNARSRVERELTGASPGWSTRPDARIDPDVRIGLVEGRRSVVVVARVPLELAGIALPLDSTVTGHMAIESR